MMASLPRMHEFSIVEFHWNTKSTTKDPAHFGPKIILQEIDVRLSNSAS